MIDIRLEQLGMAIKKKRGNRGLREVAQEMGISHTTLSRIEGGKQPDLDTFSKICKWLEVNPADILNIDSSQTEVKFNHSLSVQFRADKSLSSETANRLGEMIIAVQNMIKNEQLT